MILNQVYFVTNCVNVYVLMYMRAFSRNVKHRRGLEGEQVLGVVYLGGCVSWETGGLGADGWMSQATDEL